MKIIFNYLALTGIILFTLLGTSTYSQTDSTGLNDEAQVSEIVLNSFGLFENNDPLEITLAFDITTYLKKKPQEEYLDALLTFKYDAVDSSSRRIRIRARGNYRYRTCPFPPIRLKFKDAGFGFSDLDSLNNVKMVTHCQDNQVYQNYLMREYLIYRLYNIITDYSFRVRFVKVRYKDTGKRGLDFEQYGFLIEPLDMLLARNNAIEIEDVVVGFNDIDPEIMNRIGVFQYLIGNSDWYIPMIHNFKIIKRYDTYSTHVMVVPYDFDYSGFVNADYAMPREDLDLERITDRVYLGPCRTEEEFKKTLDEFMEHKEAFIEEVRNFEYLDRSVRRELINYIESFYNLYKRDVILKRLIKECEGIK